MNSWVIFVALWCSGWCRTQTSNLLEVKDTLYMTDAAEMPVLLPLSLTPFPYIQNVSVLTPVHAQPDHRGSPVLRVLPVRPDGLPVRSVALLLGRGHSVQPHLDERPAPVLRAEQRRGRADHLVGHPPVCQGVLHGSRADQSGHSGAGRGAQSSGGGQGQERYSCQGRTQVPHRLRGCEGRLSVLLPVHSGKRSDPRSTWQ